MASSASGAMVRAAQAGAVLVLLGLLYIPTAACAEIRVTDDLGRAVVLRGPAQRIVSLAPHATELLFTIGAGARIVGTVDFSDFPPAARAIPRIGGSAGIALERIVALRPDLIVGWASGNPRQAVERLRALGFPVYLTQPRRPEDIARNLEHLGRLTGTRTAAESASAAFLARYRMLAARYAGKPSVRVFYQVLDPSLMTVNGEHLISEVLRICGGRNVFAGLPVIAPAISEEAVLKADPEAIVAGGTDEGWRRWRAHWRARTELTAVRRGALYFISADLLHRHTVRVLDGAAELCAALEDARKRREVRPR